MNEKVSCSKITRVPDSSNYIGRRANAQTAMFCRELITKTESIILAQCQLIVVASADCTVNT